METIIQSDDCVGLKNFFASAKLRKGTKQGLTGRIVNVLTDKAFEDTFNPVSFKHSYMSMFEAVKVGLELNKRNFGGVNQTIVVTKKDDSYTITFKTSHRNPSSMTQLNADPCIKTFDELPPEVRRRKELSNNISTLLRIREKGYPAILPVILPRQKEFMASFEGKSTDEIDEAVEKLRKELYNPVLR